MSAVAIAEQTIVECECGSIGNTDGVRMCSPHHRYYFNDQRLTSFSKMLNTVYPQKREEMEKIDPATLEHALERGVRTDRYASEFLRTGEVTIQPGEWREVLDRVAIFIDWYERTQPIVRGVQQIVYSVEDGLAATKDFDFVINETPAIVDMKCTFAPDWTWKLQLGAHARYSKNGSDLYILHINPGLYKKTGLKLIPYNAEECAGMFDAALAWWKVLRPNLKEEV